MVDGGGGGGEGGGQNADKNTVSTKKNVNGSIVGHNRSKT
jgi:hypothetical protein